MSKNSIQLTPCSPLDSTILYPDVLLQNYTYTRGKMMFMPQGLRLGGMTPFAQNRPTSKTNKGNHLHLCVNGQQHQISNENIFDCPLPNGKHELVAFIARSFYESIKHPEAIIAKEIVVRNGELVSSNNLAKVAVVYNAPLGTFRLEEGSPLLFDFVLVGTSIEKGGNSLRVTINQTQVFELDKWQAYHLEGLTAGKHLIQLELLDASGHLIADPVQQEFVIEANK